MPDLDVSDNTPINDEERRKAVLQGIALPNPFSSQVSGLPPVTLTQPTKAAALYSAPPAAAPSPVQASSSLPPVQVSPEDQRVQTAQKNLATVMAKPSLEQRTTDWGNRFHDEHPGIIGRLGQVGAGILRGVETAGEVVAPGIAGAIPGTQVNLAQQRKVATEQANQAEEGAQRAATTAHTKAETKKVEKETEQMDQPSADAAKTVNTDQGVMQWDPATQRYSIRVGDVPQKEQKPTIEATDQGFVMVHPDGTATPITVNGKPLMSAKQQKPDTPEQQFFDSPEEQGKTMAQKVKDYASASQKPPQTIVIGPDNRAQAVRPGTQVAEGSRTPSQAGTQALEMVIGRDKNGRMVAANADEARSLGLKGAYKVGEQEVEKIQNARTLAEQFTKTGKAADDAGILQLAYSLNKDGKLGPLVSRWNDILTHKVGVSPGDDPRIISLFNKLDLAQTALMQVHFGASGGRSPVLLEHFQQMANAKKMDGNTLYAGLKAELNYIQDKAMMPAETK